MERDEKERIKREEKWEKNKELRIANWLKEAKVLDMKKNKEENKKAYLENKDQLPGLIANIFGEYDEY